MTVCPNCGAGTPDRADSCPLCHAPLSAGVYDMQREHYRAPGEAGRAARYPQPTAKRRKSRLGTPLTAVAVLAALALTVFLIAMAFKYLRRIPEPTVSAEKPGVINILDEPRQVMIENAEAIRNDLNGSRALPRAEYTISAEVLDVLVNAKYGDKEVIMPIDLALVWGKVATTDYNEYFDYRFDRIWKRNQWLVFTIHGNLPEGITGAYITAHVSNNHVFPANENIYNAVARLKKHQEVLLSGYLVDATDAQGNGMGTSLSRDDTEAGACECFYVDRVQVGDKVYR